MDDDKLAIEEARRAGQHGAVKSQVEGEVQAEIADQSAQTPAADARKIGEVADRFRTKASDVPAALLGSRKLSITSFMSSMHCWECVFCWLCSRPEAARDSYASSSR